MFRACKEDVIALDKRLSKKQIKEDKLVTTAFRTSEYIQKNPTPFVIGGVVMAVIFAAILLFMWNADKIESESMTLLARGRLSMETGQAETGKSDLENLITGYSDTKAAGAGALILANYHYTNGQYEDALKYFRMIIENYGGQKMILADAASGAAACLARNKEYAEAARLHEVSADAFPERIWAPGQMKEAVFFYLQAGDTTAAVAVIEKLDSLYETSTESMAAQRLLAEITY